MNNLKRPCEHGRYAPHGGCSIARCQEEHWYTEDRGPHDKATYHEVPQKGHWSDPGFEYSPLYWEPCEHEPHCSGGTLITEDPEWWGQAVSKMMPGMFQTVLAVVLGLKPDTELMVKQADFLLRAALGIEDE